MRGGVPAVRAGAPERHGADLDPRTRRDAPAPSRDDASAITVPRSAPTGARAAIANGRGASAPPDGLVGVAAFDEIDVKYAHVSKSPNFARSVAPSTGVTPREPTTSAVMIRGDTPRFTTRMPLNDALHERAELLRRRRHRQLRTSSDAAARPPSNSSSTDTSHGFGCVPQRRVLDRLGATAGGREEVRDDRLALVGDDLPARVRHRRVGRRLLDPDAAVDLRARVGVVVEVGALGRRDRVGARRDRLRTQRLGRPRSGRLGGHDALQVVVEPDDVGHRQALEHRRLELQNAAVRALAVQRRHVVEPGHLQRRRERRQRAGRSPTGRPASARGA